MSGARILACAFALLALAVAGCGGDDEPATLVLEPIDTPGEDPFTEPVGTDRPGVRTAVSVASDEGENAPPANGKSALEYAYGEGETAPLTGLGDGEDLTASGLQPALYGGTGELGNCDAQALVDFLEADEGKGAAWAEALGSEPGAIADYVSGLTPLVLRVDTLVTNHGFANGEATPRQAVLQAGTAVLVDRQGVPRVRCACGNPLTEAAGIDRGAAEVRGKAWEGSDPAQAVAIAPAENEASSFTVLDLDENREVEVSAGSQGAGSAGDAPVQLLGDGLGIVGPDGQVTETLAVGDPFAEVERRLTELLGEPTGRTNPAANDQCFYPSTQWDELAIHDDGGDFVHYIAEAFRVDFDTQEIETIEPRGLAATPEGVGVGDKAAAFARAYPALEGQPLQGGSFRYVDGEDRLFVVEEGVADGRVTTVAAGSDCVLSG